MKIIEGTFSFLKETGHIISFAGGGGKTSLMYALAGKYAENGAKVLVTTTTHMEMPDETVWARTPDQAKHLWARGTYAVVGNACGEGKMGGLPEKELKAFMSMAEITLIEADGAKHMPCKIPAAHEPVIPEECDIVIGVMGMDAVGKPIEEVCFRKEEVCRFLNADPTERLSVGQIADILASEKGTRKNVGGREYCIILNKCDTKDRILTGRRIKEKLCEKGISNIVLTTFESLQEI